MSQATHHFTDTEILSIARKLKSLARYASCDAPNSCTGECHGCRLERVGAIADEMLAQLKATP